MPILVWLNGWSKRVYIRMPRLEEWISWRPQPVYIMMVVWI